MRAQLIVSRPDYSPAWQALGTVALRQGRNEEAIESLNRAIALGGDGAVLRFDLACALEQQGRWEEAVAHLRHAAVLNPQSGEAHINLAALLEKLDRAEEALEYGRRAIALCPKNAIAHFNLATVWQSLGNLEAAIATYSQAIELDKNFALAYTSRGCCRLLQSDYAAGWPDYEWRLQTCKVEITKYQQPRWNGQPLPQGTLLVHGEQGVGDEILFASCLPELVPLVGKCVLVCDPRLAKLMARSFPAVAIVGHGASPTDRRRSFPFRSRHKFPPAVCRCICDLVRTAFRAANGFCWPIRRSGERGEIDLNRWVPA